MKKISLAIILSVLALIPVLSGPTAVFAAADEKVNARILPSVWYSDLSFSDGNSLDIFGAIQNNSGAPFSGVAHFFVDDKEIFTAPFQSESGSLRMIEAPWKAASGTHTVVIKIDASLPAGKALVSYESAASSVFVPKVVSPATPVTVADVQAAAMNTAGVVSSGVDKAAQALADRLEALKSDGSAPSGAVLGTSTRQSVGQGAKPRTMTASVADAGIDAGAFLLRHWVWTLSAILALWIVWKLRRNSRAQI